MNDCAWCGDGEGICQTHLDALLAESEALAATGIYRAEHEGEEQEDGQEPESEIQQHAALS